MNVSSAHSRANIFLMQFSKTQRFAPDEFKQVTFLQNQIPIYKNRPYIQFHATSPTMNQIMTLHNHRSSKVSHHHQSLHVITMFDSY